jgi:hypothetical protein
MLPSVVLSGIEQQPDFRPDLLPGDDHAGPLGQQRQDPRTRRLFIERIEWTDEVHDTREASPDLSHRYDIVSGTGAT